MEGRGNASSKETTHAQKADAKSGRCFFLKGQRVKMGRRRGRVLGCILRISHYNDPKDEGGNIAANGIRWVDTS